MKRTVTLSILLLLLAILLPSVFSRPTLSAEPTPSLEPEPTKAPALYGKADSDTRFTVLSDGSVAERTLAEYLPGAVAGEMPASFETEALRAQAVAARTYILYCVEHPSSSHPDADVCDDPSCCKAHIDTEALKSMWGADFDANWQKITGAVYDTDGEYLAYEGRAIQAVFHSSSQGVTEASGNIWQSVPYLVSVATPETADDVPNYVTTVEVTPEDFAKTIAAEYPDADFSGDPDTWLGEAEVSSTGRVKSVTIGGVNIPGGVKLRTLFALRSAAFTLEYLDGRFVFTVTGYGHGVGMSQYGANVMAKNGAGYVEILENYYPGTELKG